MTVPLLHRNNDGRPGSSVRMRIDPVAGAVYIGASIRQGGRIVQGEAGGFAASRDAFPEPSQHEQGE